MSQSTWAAKTETWTTDTHTWSNTTYQDSITFAGSNNFTLFNNAQHSVTANLTQINLSSLSEEDAAKVAASVMAMVSSTIASATVAFPALATLANQQTIKNNINFEESASMSMTSTSSSDNNFLWNDITEDTTTTWTKVADPDE